MSASPWIFDVSEADFDARVLAAYRDVPVVYRVNTYSG
jgi:thioredoxin-like negative regulator of GroEL